MERIVGLWRKAILCTLSDTVLCFCIGDINKLSLVPWGHSLFQPILYLVIVIEFLTLLGHLHVGNSDGLFWSLSEFWSSSHSALSDKSVLSLCEKHISLVSDECNNLYNKMAWFLVLISVIRKHLLHIRINLYCQSNLPCFWACGKWQ